ncbi:MAG: hypothetical protein JW854_05645 [Actinobacteria bacterium]|nr:hypothetical protein [Actinomycetota bacterium]
MDLGWSESYYADMQREAEQELSRCATPLLESTRKCRKALASYGDFSPQVRELDALLARLQELLEGYLHIKQDH